jgi:dihydroxyacetone kinase
MSTSEVVLRWLEACLTAIQAREDELGRLDAAAGDGDHGAAMVRGLRSATETARAGAPHQSAGETLKAAGAAFSDVAGGASGALIGMLLQTVGQELSSEACDAAALHIALQAGLQAVCRLGKAKPGDKTLIDPLSPFVAAFGDAAAAGEPLGRAWRLALPAAEQGALSTADMIARRGRSARLGERSRGHLDPGAVSLLIMLQAVGNVLASAEP